MTEWMVSPVCTQVAELNPGDWVEFEASMTAHGHRGDPEVGCSPLNKAQTCPTYRTTFPAYNSPSRQVNTGR